jgi:hypothetical protein
MAIIAIITTYVKYFATEDKILNLLNGIVSQVSRLLTNQHCHSLAHYIGRFVFPIVSISSAIPYRSFSLCPGFESSIPLLIYS